MKKFNTPKVTYIPDRGQTSTGEELANPFTFVPADGGGYALVVDTEINVENLEVALGEGLAQDDTLQASNVLLQSIFAQLSAIEADLEDIKANVIEGAKIAEILDETDLVGSSLTLAAIPEYVRILNTDTNDAVFTINNISIPVPSGATLETGIDTTNGSTTVIVAGSTQFYFQRLV